MIIVFLLLLESGLALNSKTLNYSMAANAADGCKDLEFISYNLLCDFCFFTKNFLRNSSLFQENATGTINQYLSTWRDGIISQIQEGKPGLRINVMIESPVLEPNHGQAVDNCLMKVIGSNGSEGFFFSCVLVIQLEEVWVTRYDNYRIGITF